MEDNYYIKTLLEKIESADPKSFSQFAHEHPICFQEKKGNWLFPMMFDFYVKKYTMSISYLYLKSWDCIYTINVRIMKCLKLL